MDSQEREIGILLPKKQRQHPTLHVQKDVLPCALCSLLRPVSAPLARIFRMDWTSTSFKGGGLHQHQTLNPSTGENTLLPIGELNAFETSVLSVATAEIKEPEIKAENIKVFYFRGLRKQKIFYFKWAAKPAVPGSYGAAVSYERGTAIL